MPRVLMVLIPLALAIYTVIDAIQTDDSRVQFLPKVVWILLILLSAPTGIGAVAWLVTGRHRGPQNGRPRPNSPSAPRGPDDDPDFLRNL
ncbi:MAG: PLDc N-terminal domain-containing protein [Actinobacteria bacterium]|nr:PLDc N-terminal domain-containing protein [Actinomycetota bacterium]